MNRNIVYPGAIPLDTDILSINQNTMIALGFIIRATIGTGTVADGLICSPTLPASMSVQIGPGSLIQLSVVDATPYGSLGADTNDPLVKMGINLTSQNFTLQALRWTPSVGQESGRLKRGSRRVPTPLPIRGEA
jgi:hypothetical protein